MKSDDIIIELSKAFPTVLATDLVKEFVELRKDLQTLTLNRASA
jgi:hypothetical protein